MPGLHVTERIALAEAGRTSEAQAAAEKATHLQPAFSINFLRNQFMAHRETTLNSLFDGLRKANVRE